MSEGSLQIELDHSYLIINKQEATIRELRAENTGLTMRREAAVRGANAKIKELEVDVKIIKDHYKNRDRIRNEHIAGLEAENAQLKQTNMSLCRDLDEAQRAYENAIGIGDSSADLTQSIGVDDGKDN